MCKINDYYDVCEGNLPSHFLRLSKAGNTTSRLALYQLWKPKQAGGGMLYGLCGLHFGVYTMYKGYSDNYTLIDYQCMEWLLYECAVDC